MVEELTENVVIEKADDLDDDELAAVGGLISQLSASASTLSRVEADRLLANESCNLLLAREAGNRKIMGMLTLVVFPIPTGTRAWIEDVVVDKGARGLGIGKLLTRYAIEQAKVKGAVSIDLTSRPSREVANAMYRSLGFKARDTNVYRFTGN